jgi:APA family basic amino acid/polyamine antiporter
VGLARDLKLSHACALVVGIIIGSGIFLVPTEMMQAVGSVKLTFLVWLVGGLLSFFGALTYAELGAMKPQAGGEYVYIRDAYGALAAFLYAWAWCLIAKPAAIATITTGIVRVLQSFPAFAYFGRPWLLHPVAISYGQLIAVAITLFISWVNYIGVRRAGDFQLLFTALKVALILAIVGIGFSYSAGTWANFSSEYSGATGGLGGFFAALVAALWAYDGWNDLNMVAGEVRDPQRNIPIALIWGVATVGVLYVLVNAAVQYVMPAAAIAATPRPAADAVALVLGPVGASLVAAAMAVSMLGTLNGSIMSGGRLAFAPARDGYFFRVFAQVHPRFRTPSVAIAMQCALSVALLLIGGSFRQFFSLEIFSAWMFYMIAGSTVFVFRHREPLTPRPYRVWGYPVVPALFVLSSSVLLYYTFIANARASTLGCLAILAGVPVFYFFAQRRASAAELASRMPQPARDPD